MQSILALKKVKNPCGHPKVHVPLSRFVAIVIPALAQAPNVFQCFIEFVFIRATATELECDISC